VRDGRGFGANCPLFRRKRKTANGRRHDLYRYYYTKRDGRWLCIKCGLHYVRRTCINRQHCAGEPVKAAAHKALRDAAEGNRLVRRKVFKNALKKSGANQRLLAAFTPDWSGKTCGTMIGNRRKEHAATASPGVTEAPTRRR
jgi:hypothetical protein